MKNSIHYVCHTLVQRYYFYLIASFIYLFSTQSAFSQCVAAKGSIEGIVYRDANNNGLINADETGLGGILVEAYSKDGSLVSSMTTPASGIYTFTNLQDEETIRLIFNFDHLYASSLMGPDNGSSVQFVQIPACGVGFGLVSESDICNMKTEIITTCFVQGNTNSNQSEPTIVGIEYGFNSDSPPRKLASHGETGSIWGLTWRNQTKEIFSAAFVKQYAGLTPSGHDAIFKTVPTGSGFTTSLFTKLSALGQTTGTLSVTDINDCNFGSQVGKIGLGALIVSPDENHLYTINLFNNTLVKIPTVSPNAANTTSYKIPDPACSDGEYRAFALKYYEGKIYVGVTCTAETAKSDDASSANVYEFDPKTEDFSLIFTTTYLKGYWFDTPSDGLGQSHWLTDIDFTDNGNMLLSFTDRLGHRYCKAATNRLDEQKPDLLMVWKNNGKWELENNGSAGALTGVGVGNGQGPGNGEFFGDDFWITQPIYHSEIAIGSIFVMPGTNSVVAAVFDPEVNAYSGGLHRYNTINGSKEGSKELYTRDVDVAFGKATGFGEIIATCGAPDIEIGNLVWNDENGNGIQDADEKGFANVFLQLYDETCNLIGTTETNSKGNYAFNNNNVSIGLVRDATYYLGIDSKHYDAETESYNLGDNYYDITNHIALSPYINSDALGGSLSCGPAILSIQVEKTQHTFDIGLVPAGTCSLKISKTVVSDKTVKIDDIVLFEISVLNAGGTKVSGVSIEDKLPLGYVFVPELNTGWTNDNGTLKTDLSGNMVPGSKLSTVLSLTFDKNVKNIDYVNVAKIVAIKDIAGVTMTDIKDCLVVPEDAQDDGIPTVCDLALIHKVEADRIYTPDTEVSFVTTVCNQGTIDASGFEITNYLNSELDFDPIQNPGWVLSSDLKYITFSDPKVLASKVCRNYRITFTILDDVTVSEIVNYAEISQGSCVGSPLNYDFDSTPDFNISNDKGGQPKTTTDNMMDDSGNIDEDDHDPAVVRLDLVDLSLVKTVTNRRANAGDVVVFNLTVKNEGNVPVSRTKVVDYVPSTTDLADPSWTKTSEGAEKTLIFPGNLQPGQSYVTQCSLKIHNNVIHPATVYNTAEIVEMYDQFNRNISAYDVDSTPDNIRNNDFDENQKDLLEDDISVTYVVLSCPAVYEPCSSCRGATTSTNGQFEVILKVASRSGENWFVESSSGLYDTISPYPPLAPIKLANGFELEEVDHEHSGHSYYLLKAVHLDGKGFDVILRNENGFLESVSALPATCTFAKIDLEGPRSLCLGGQATYTASTTIDDADFIWIVDGDTISGEESYVLDFDWSVAPYNTLGQHTVTVAGTPGCISPTATIVTLGQADGGLIACIGDFNVSLDGDCSVTITPAMMAAGNLNPNSPYSVMLLDKAGNPIPNATLTEVHAGTKVIAKLIEGCGGNTCWSTITVEDKIAPISVCSDIYLPCYTVDQFKGPFKTDNCNGPVLNLIVSENITPLVCDEDYIKYIDRVYQATDLFGNKSELCEMRIYVERPDFSLIKFPHSLTMLNDSVLICNSYEKDDLGRPAVSVSGVPTLAGLPLYPVFAPICNVYTGFTDVEIANIGCTRKIIRNWTVYEQWCSSGQVENFAQVIEITDTIPPVIAPFPNITLSTSSHGICEANVTLPVAVVTDSCQSAIVTDVTYPGGFIKNHTAPAIVTLPVGDHSITYTAYDACYNSSQINFTATVQDKTPPTVICKGIIAVGLNSLGSAYVYPQNLNDGSFDGCGIDSMKIARMVPSGLIPDSLFKDAIEFKCIDAGRSIMVALRVWDANGNSNSCMMSVEIQDKHAPKISCPDDLTIDCSEVFTGIDLPLLFGTATAVDACGATVTELTPKFVLNSCRVGYIERTFVATDGLGSASCQQIITVENENFFNPKTDVVYPLDYEVTNNKCSADELKPENLPIINGFPIITQSACGMAAASYQDAVFTFVTGACFKILRTWTIIDWCEMQRQGDDYSPFVYQQLIKVNNTEPPFFVGTVKARDTINTLPGNCFDANVSLKVTGRDLCTPDTILRWSYKVDLLNNGSYDLPNQGLGNMAILNATLPVGLHKIQWSFEDACGNVATKDQLIYIRNIDKPTAAGLESVGIAIIPCDTNGDGIPDIEKGCIIASSLDASSSSVCCTDPLKFSFSPDINDTIRCFDCFDVGILNTVELWVHDCYGNTDFVEVNVDVQDNNDSEICERICEDNAPTPTIAGTNIICNGKSTTLTASGGVEYTWNTGATTAAITVSPIVTTSYTVTVSNLLGCTASASRTVTVNPIPNVAIAGANICNGGSTSLTASGGTTYLWNTGATTALISVSPIINTTYTVTATNANSCTASVSRVVSVSALPIVSVSGNNIICRNSSTSLTAAGGSTYLWNTGASTTAITVSPIVNTTYTVTATNINGCSASSSRAVTVNALPVVNVAGNNIICVGAATALTASGGLSYLWNTGATTSIINVNPVVATTYTVTATDVNGCTGSSSRPVTVNPLPNASISGNNIICRNASTLLTAAGGSTYLWNTGATTIAINVNPITNTTFTVTVTDVNGCVSSSNRSVTVNPLPIINVTGNNSICLGASTALTATGGQTYLWNTGATTSVINVAPIVTTTYTVTATDNNGCTGTANRTVTVNPNPTAVISGDNMICVGESTNLTASGGTTYIWNTGATTALINVIPITTTSFSVTVTDANGCRGNTSATVFVDQGTLTCTTQNITAYLGPNGSVLINPQDISTGAMGACTNITAVVTPNQFFCNDVGLRVVTLTVTNTVNNQMLSCTAQVTVQDTLDPVLVCPINVTINCDDYNPNSPLSSFGSATATDNCANNLIITELPIINLNQCRIGQITRTFTATDNSGNTKQCVQIISVINNNPISLANITFPNDISVSNCLGITPAVTGNTVVNASNADCSDISISFTDDLPPATPLCRDTIMRTWQVIDSCQLLAGTNNGRFTRVQRIIVVVNPSIITGPIDTTLVVNPITCQATLTGVFHVASGCNLTLSNSINNSASFNLSGLYPSGITNVVLTAVDGCSNLSSNFNFQIEVSDTSSTDLRCRKTFPAMLDLNPPSVIDNVANHAIIEVSCGTNLIVDPSYSRTNINDTIRIYDCDDLLIDFPIEVFFWSNGVVIDSCTSLATPTDPNAFCSGGLVTVAGSVKTESLQKVSGVIIDLNGSDLPTNISNQDGRYKFPYMVPGGEYEVVPQKNDKPLEGVSTLDLIYLQQHILRSKLLESPYQMIAADINKDNKISAADIVQLRKLILGIYDKFPNNHSWRMIDADYLFPDPKDPFITQFAEKYHIDNLSQNMTLNWVGVKIGDLNGSFVANSNGAQVASRTSDFDLSIQDEYIAVGNNTIPVSASKDQNLKGFQISMKLSNSHDVSIDAGALNLDKSNYHFANGYLVISWHDVLGIDVKAGDKLFEIVLKTDKKAKLSEIIASDVMVLKPEYYNASNELGSLGIQFKNVLNDHFNVWGNTPNPWNNETSINFYLPASGSIVINIRDITGRIVFSSKTSYPKGENTIILNKDVIGLSGLLIYDLTFDHETKTLKMLNIE